MSSQPYTPLLDVVAIRIFAAQASIGFPSECIGYIIDDAGELRIALQRVHQLDPFVVFDVGTHDNKCYNGRYYDRRSRAFAGLILKGNHKAIREIT